MINHRKLYPYSKYNTTTLPCLDICDSTCPYGCDSPSVDAYPIPPPPPLPPQMSPPVSAEQSGHVSPYVIVIVTLFAGCFFVLIFYLIAVKFLSRWNVFRPRQRQPEDTNEEFLADDRGQLTAIDHPIWYINTTGLQQSVISSITIFRYKKGDHFIESTECAVCLNEFRNDDALRLLPKCSHAFHIHCIDTWLRSHVNCPVCRAGIVCSVATSAPVASNALNFTNLRRNEDSQVENGENGEGLNVNQARDDGFCENGIGTGEIIEVQQEDHGGKDVGIVKISRVPTESSASWVIEGINDRGMMTMNGGNNKRQPVRRSVSVDSLLARRISEVCLSECEDSSVSEDQIAGADRDSSNNVGVNSAAQRITRGGSSVAQFLHTRPVRMKRSYSYSERSLFSRQHSRNNSSASSVIPINFPIRKIRQ